MEIKHFLEMIHVSFLLPAPMTPFADMAFIIKSNSNNGRNPPSCPFPTIMTHFPDIAFINEEAIGASNEAAKCYWL